MEKTWCRECGEVLEYHAGHGLCQACYSRRRYRKDPEFRKLHHRRTESWRKRNFDKVRLINRRANRGRCPICDRMYAHIRTHLKCMHPPGEYRDLLEQVLEEKRREREEL